MASANAGRRKASPSAKARRRRGSPSPVVTSDARITIEQKSTTSGWISHLPLEWVPYIQLMRLDRFNGFWYFWLPHFYGILLSAIEQRSSVFQFVYINVVMVWGVLIMRGATCTWNDTVDAPFDRQVSRCKNRPVARGAVSYWQANTFTAFQTLISLGTLSLLPPAAFLYAIPAIVGWILYPLCKRVTYYPQVFLGFPMAWGIFMGAVATGSDPLNLDPVLRALVQGEDIRTAFGLAAIKSPAICAFYGANVLWTLLYETIYSHQDAAEDVAAGVKNIVILYADTTGPQIKFGTMPLLIRLAIGQILLLSAAGSLANASVLYYFGTVAGSAAASAVVLSKVRLAVPSDCAWWFKVGCCFSTGGAMASGLAGDYLLTLLKV